MNVHIISFALCLSVGNLEVLGFFLVYTAGSSTWYLAIVLSFVMRAGLSDGLLFECGPVFIRYFYVKERMFVKAA